MELEFVKRLIKQHMPGYQDFYLQAAIGERYYRNRTDILYTPREEAESDAMPLRNADNRIPRNFHGLIVNQKAAYAFTAPPLFDVGNEAANKRITAVLGDEYAKNCMELCINAANTSVGWLHYFEQEGRFQWAVMDSKDIIPIFDDRLRKNLVGVLRVRDELDEEDGYRYMVYEYWNDKKGQAYRMRISDTLEEGLTCYHMFEDPDNGEPAFEYEHGFEEVPFIPFWNNNIHTNDLANIKPLIDVYDKVFSGFINDLDDVQELIFVLSGYGGTELNGFLQDLKRYKAIKLDDDEDGRPGVSTLNIEIPIEARNSVLEATRKAIFEQGQGFDPQPESFGNQSGVALKFMYSLLEMKAGLMEIEFRIGFSKLIRAICQHEGLAADSIIQTWTRTGIRNDVEQAQICRDSEGIVSRLTILKNHPLVQDAEAELKQLEKEEQERQEQADLYQEAFQRQNSDGPEEPKGGEPVNGEET